MAYGRLVTTNKSGLHPNLRGVGMMGSYAAMDTVSKAGLSPNFRGMGDVPLTQLTIGPGGQFAISTATTPTSESLYDQFLTWMAQPSVFVPGLPNSVLLIGGGIFAAAWLMGGRHRR